jgi:predicted acetyltransferase
MVTTVRLVGPPEHPLLLTLPEQDLTGGTELWYMLRLIDAAGAIAARGFPRITAAVDLELTDRACDWNTGRWRLVVEDGEGRLEKGGAGTVGMAIGALAALYSGYSSTTTLAGAGLLRGAGARERDALDTAFGGPTPWMPDFF